MACSVPELSTFSPTPPPGSQPFPRTRLLVGHCDIDSQMMPCREKETEAKALIARLQQVFRNVE